MTVTPVPTDEQAAEALKALTGQLPDPSGEPAIISLPVVEAAPGAAEAVAAEAEPIESDDVESLKARMDEVEKRYEARFEAFKSRTLQNERILRDRYLKKATATDAALKILKGARTEYGVSEADADRVIKEIEASMNPASQSYVASEAQAPAPNDDGAMVVNNFLNEQGLSTEEADAFIGWVRTEAPTSMSPAEMAVGDQSLDGFLRLAYARFERTQGDGEAPKPPGKADVIGAVKAVQRTQRAAIRAGSATPSAPRKQPAGSSAEIDYSKITKDDVSALLRAASMPYH